MASASVAQCPSVMHTPGPMAEHSLSEAHLRHVFAAAVAVAVAWQIGVVPEQVALSMHCTHTPVAPHAV
jgi:hypothetical protein